MMMLWIHLLSFVYIAGAVSALRLILFPSLDLLAPEMRTLAAGAVMSRVRNVLPIALWIWTATGLWLLLPGAADWMWKDIAGGIAGVGLFVSVSLLTISPHRRLALRTQPRRLLLLNAGLICAAALLLLVYFR